jgi:predicted Ser/Thr protein kinase
MITNVNLGFIERLEIASLDIKVVSHVISNIQEINYKYQSRVHGMLRKTNVVIKTSFQMSVAIFKR